MIPKECKRLAEVDFPIAEVSRHGVSDKSGRSGHPHRLHLWWARRPLASSRAVLLSLLWPDPCDPACPEAFKTEARKRLPRVGGCNPGTTDHDLQRALLRFIADFADLGNAANHAYLEVSRALVKAAHANEKGADDPLVVDPFSGGGSIPLEALRVGCDAFASDLNAVACLILKVMLEDIPRNWPRLSDELLRVGANIKNAAEGVLAEFYPKDPDGALPIAYLWARTVRCESPNCGAEIPLVRSFWLCEKASRRCAVKYSMERPKGEAPSLAFTVFHPTSERDVPRGTVSRAKATCLCCGIVLSPDRVRAQLTAQRGGADVVFDATQQRVGGARLLAVATLKAGDGRRHYRSAVPRDYEPIVKAQLHVAQMIENWDRGGRLGVRPIPDEPLPLMSGTFNVPIYGMHEWGDLFTFRQKAAIAALIGVLRGKGDRQNDGEYVIRELLALSIGKLLRHCNVVSKWHRNSETVAGAFGMQALPMSWDFPEMFPLAPYAGGLGDAISDVAEIAATIAAAAPRRGQVENADAGEHPLPDDSAAVWFTDPPYYFAIPYADLSDFFLVWLKRMLPDQSLLADRFDPSNPLSHKARELCEMAHWDPARYAHKDKSYFESGMARAFAEGNRVLRPDGIGCVVFAHKTTEGWEALLTGLHQGGWTITGSWPIATERGARLRARESAALATSVHLVCRPRPDDAPVGDWADVLRELPTRVADWMERLQGEGVRGADLVFACIGPALEIFSRFTKVETAEGREVRLDEYLTKVWEVVGRAALAQVLGTAEARARNGAAGAVEEDARLTALFLWTLQATDGDGAEGASGEEEDEDAPDDEGDEGGPSGKPKGFTLVFDVVRRFAQPLGIELSKWEGRVIEIKKGVVRLLPIAERAKQLFGEDGATAVAARLEEQAARGPASLQGMLFPDMEPPSKRRAAGGRGQRGVVDVPDEAVAAPRDATTLDRVHAAMLLQASGRTNALRALLRSEQDRGPDFLRLANALSALYPKGSEEKRLLDAMLLAVPR